MVFYDWVLSVNAKQSALVSDRCGFRSQPGHIPAVWFWTLCLSFMRSKWGWMVHTSWDYIRTNYDIQYLKNVPRVSYPLNVVIGIHINVKSNSLIILHCHIFKLGCFLTEWFKTYSILHIFWSKILNYSFRILSQFDPLKRSILFVTIFYRLSHFFSSCDANYNFLEKQTLI